MIKDMPDCERPRERLEEKGAASLSIHELIAIVISSGGKNNSALEIANAIMSDVASPGDLAGRTVAELARIKGVGRAKATKLLASIELGRRVMNKNRDMKRIVSPGDEIGRAHV